MLGSLFRRQPALAQAGAWALSAPLFRLTDSDVAAVGDAVEGILITGRTGSGKSSASGQIIAKSFLRSGWGGLVLTAKPDERSMWEAYCRATGRLADLVVFNPAGNWRFNMLDSERSRAGVGAGLTENLLSLLSTVTELIERSSGHGAGRSDQTYWKRAKDQLVRNAIDLLSISGESVSVPNLYRLVVSAPTALDQVKSEAWRKQSYCFHCLTAGDTRPKTPRQRGDFTIAVDYFMQEFPALSEKTRSVILSTVTSTLDVLNRGLVRELFSEGTNISPEAIPQGKIVLVDLPVKEYGEVGLTANILWKYAFMRSIERRDLSTNHRPVFLWQDEGQLFTTSHDMMFQTTARSSRVATVILTQSVNNFYAVLGEGQQGKAMADGLFANLSTKIMHANGDPVTNEWASTLIGKRKEMMLNVSGGQQTGDWGSILTRQGGSQGSASLSEHYEYELQPSAFTRLRTGGPANGWCADAIVISSGVCFKRTGRNWAHCIFSQR